MVNSCNSDNAVIDDDTDIDPTPDIEIPKRPGPRPETTLDVPHVQIDVDPVPAVNEELFRRVFSIPGIENHPSVVGGWEGLWLSEDVNINKPDALIDDREFAHIHDDGSLHIFLEPPRSETAVDSCWAIFHPFAVEQMVSGPPTDPAEKSWLGFVMLYTPQSIEELNVTFQLIVDGFNYVSGENRIATDYY